VHYALEPNGAIAKVCMHRQMDNLKTMPPAPSIGQVEAQNQLKSQKIWHTLHQKSTAWFISTCWKAYKNLYHYPKDTSSEWTKKIMQKLTNPDSLGKTVVKIEKKR